MEFEKKLKILMLEDNPHDVLLIERILRKDNLAFETRCVDTRQEFTDAVIEFHPDVVLSDHGLPQFNSIEALKICLTEKLFVPFILVTGTVSEEFAITCLRNGADDYILKSNLSRLPLAIRRAIKERKLEALKREARRALRNKNEELSRTNTELDNFVYCVSHNLRGPLKSVTGLLHLARLEPRDAQLENLHARMDSSIKNLDHTLLQILDYSKNSRSDIVAEKLDWSNLFEESIEKLSYLNTREKIKWTFNLSTEHPFVGDKNRISTVITNVLSNAMSYVSESPEILVELDVTEEVARVVIRDNGIGIEKNLMPRVFDMFFRGTELSEGSGLGLYIVKNILRMLGGQVELDSAPGRGTTVFLRFSNEATATENQ